MMLEPKFFVAAICLLLVPVMANSADVWHTSKLQSVYPLANGDIVLIFQNDAASCTRPDKYHYITVGINSVTAEGRDNMFAVALAALTADLSVQVNFDDASNDCNVNRLKADR